jgi:pimeloyl-ACP methyl ester carboxylesterase
MEIHRFRASDGLVLNCLDYGGAGKTAVLFVHGGSAHAHWWDFTAPALVDRFHVLALDQRGHGDSPWSREWAYRTRHYIADLHAIITGWSFGPPVLLGHSMGGHNVMVYAASHSGTLRGMAAIDSPATNPPYAVKNLRDIAERPARRFDSLAEACANFRTIPDDTIAKPEVMRHVAAHSFRQVGDGKWIHKMDRRTMMREPSDAWPLLGAIQCPALFARAANSVIRDGHGEKMAAAMPRGRFAIVPDSHHHVLLDNPAGLAAALGEFLAGIE